MLAIGLTGWTGVARLVRGEFLRLKNQDFVTAAHALGASGARVMFRHILPNALGPVLVSVTFGVASAILTESGLSFLGLGDVNLPSWGKVLNGGIQHMVRAPWLVIFPGGAIFLTTLALNLAGEGLRDAMDPRLRE
jgi:peptide/nickel transport system permease protein